MASTYQQAKVTGFANYFPSATPETLAEYRDIFEANRHRVYALAFWMTDHELAAEQLMLRAFRRLFTRGARFDSESVDRALLAEIRTHMAVGKLSLKGRAVEKVEAVRRNTMRVHLERAVVELPATERLIFVMHDVEGYDHTRIARTLGLAEEQSISGLHEARLRIRELLAAMA
jgi:RNA polymerase sigma-70 factor (ECF subfamily)